MADIINQTVFNVPLATAIKFFAEASYVSIIADIATEFNAFAITQEGIKTKAVLTLVNSRDDSSESVSIENPQFKFDSTSNEIYIENEDKKYIFRFLNEKSVDFDSLKDFLS